MSVIEIRRDAERDPDGRHMQELLRAMDRADRFGALRQLVINALAILGGILWVGVAVPDWLPDSIRRVVLAGFAALTVGGIIAIVLERRWLRLQQRCMGENDARVLGGDESSPARPR